MINKKIDTMKIQTNHTRKNDRKHRHDLNMGNTVAIPLEEEAEKETSNWERLSAQEFSKTYEMNYIARKISFKVKTF